MDEDTLNMQVRQFLKEFGVTSQREIENEIRTAVEEGTLAGDEAVEATATARVDRLDVEVTVTYVIELE